MYHNCPQPVTPYQVGVVLDSGERPLIEIPVRFLNEGPPGNETPATWSPPIRPWLITTHRVVGRLGDDRLYRWRWQKLIESISIQPESSSPLTLGTAYHSPGWGRLSPHWQLHQSFDCTGLLRFSITPGSHLCDRAPTQLTEQDMMEQGPRWPADMQRRQE
jgi:hypothetical protein